MGKSLGVDELVEEMDKELRKYQGSSITTLSHY